MPSTNGKRHLSQSYTLSKSFDRETVAETWQGDQREIEEYLDGLSIGDPAAKRSGRIVTGINMRRLNGGVCESVVQSARFLKKAIWGFDFRALSKPTITFRYPGETDETVNRRAHLIRGWEALRDANRLPEYFDYKFIRYDDANEEIGVGDLADQTVPGGGLNTLAIARKILRGQEVYNVYYPVITLTRTSEEPFTDDLESIGKQSSPSVKMGGWTSHGNPDQARAFVRLKAYWVKTADNITTNPDGSFTRREQWTGMDDLDADFYPPYQ